MVFPRFVYYFYPSKLNVMRKLLSANCSSTAFNISMLLIRITFGLLMMGHGYNKLMEFASLKSHFLNFLGLGSTLSLALCIFAEFFCALFLIIGLFTRLVSIPLIVVMAVDALMVHHADFFGKAEMSTLYLGAYLALLIAGPGKISVDGMIGK